MEKEEVRRIAVRAACVRLAQEKQYHVPAAVSARHIHLCAADRDALFGAGYALTPMRALSQPGQYACEEKLAVVGPKGRMEGVRVLGPERPDTQVELSMSDAIALGIAPNVRMSGDIAGTPGCTLAGPKGEVTLNRGVIVAARHLHMSAQEAAVYSLKSGDAVGVRKGGVRAAVLGNVVVRAGDAHALEVHLDTDEANAAGIQTGDLLELIKDF